MRIKVSFYDYYGQLNSDQTISIQDELASLDMSLSELESYGVIAPVLNDITIMNKTYFFTKFVYHLSKIEDDDYRYIFWAKYVEEGMLLPYYNDKVDILEETVDKLGVDIKSFIYEHNDTISKLGDKVQNWDGYDELEEELELISDKNNENRRSVQSINRSDFDGQISTLEADFARLAYQSDTSHDSIEYTVDNYYDAILNHQNDIDHIRDVVSHRVKHVFLTNEEYGRLSPKDADTLYFTT